MTPTIRTSRLSITLAISLLFGNYSALASGTHTGSKQPNEPIATQRALTAEEQTIQKVLDGYAQAMETKSVALMEQAIVPDDFSTIESGYPNWTWEDFRDNHLLLEMDTFTDVNYTIELLTGELRDSLGFAIFRYTAAGKIKDTGANASVSGLGTAILEKTSAGWRIHHLHTSVPRPQSADH